MRSWSSRLLVCVIFSSALAASSQAQTVPSKGRLFVIPASDGYGVSDCFAPGATCGKVVADAWCEAHGRGPSLAFGRAEDVTASLAAEQRKAERVASDALLVSCAD